MQKSGLARFSGLVKTRVNYRDNEGLWGSTSSSRLFRKLSKYPSDLSIEYIQEFPSLSFDYIGKKLAYFGYANNLSNNCLIMEKITFIFIIAITYILHHPSRPMRSKAPVVLQG